MKREILGKNYEEPVKMTAMTSGHTTVSEHGIMRTVSGAPNERRELFNIGYRIWLSGGSEQYDERVNSDAGWDLLM